MAIKKYRQKPVVIEAVAWNGENKDEIIEFCGEKNVEFVDAFFMTKLYMLTPDGIGKCEVALGDYVIKEPNGIVQPCKSSILRERFELVEGE